MHTSKLLEGGGGGVRKRIPQVASSLSLEAHGGLITGLARVMGQGILREGLDLRGALVPRGVSHSEHFKAIFEREHAVKGGVTTSDRNVVGQIPSV